MRFSQLPRTASLPARGFTLIELMIAVTIAAILAAVAVPMYGDYVRRAQAQEALSNLADARVRLEQYYQDNRGYGPSGGTACGVTAANTKYFTLSCALGSSNQSYTLTATGAAGASQGFDYTLSSANIKGTSKYKGNTQSGKACWLVRGDEC